MVVVIPFKAELRLKFLNVIGAPNGNAPSRVKLYKNEEVVDFSIIEDKKPLMIIDLEENLEGRHDYPIIVSKFNNVTKLVLGFEDTFGGDFSQINFIGLRGTFIRDTGKKLGKITYEVRADWRDHQKLKDEKAHASSMGF